MDGHAAVERVVGAVAETAPASLPARRNEYEHLAPLFAERAGLADGHSRHAQLREELITGYLPVARNVARKYSSRGEHVDDLMQVASVGLVLAVDRYDPGRDIDFLSFAVPTIVGEVLRYYRDRSTMIRLPRRLRAVQGQVYDAAAALAQRHGRAARPSEIARHPGLDVEVVLEGLAAQGAGHTASLDAPASADADGRDAPDHVRSPRPTRSSTLSSTARRLHHCWRRCPRGNGGSCSSASSAA